MQEDVYIQMVRYFDEEMNEEERKEFKEALDQNPQLLEEVAFYRQIEKVSASVTRKLTDSYEVTSEEKNNNADLLARIRRARQNWEIVNLVKSKWKILYKKNFKLDTTPEHPPEPLEDAFDYYNMAEYKRAIEAFENIKIGDQAVTRGTEEDRELTVFYKLYYEGIAHMAEGGFQNAVDQLEKAIGKSPDSYLKSKAQWYLALACVKINDLEKTVALLKLLAENEQALDYKEKALKMISDLKKE
jgi:tetratricopeptide (TPR) repeat protein